MASERVQSVTMASPKASVSQQFDHIDINLLASHHIRHFWKALKCHIEQRQLFICFRDMVSHLTQGQVKSDSLVEAKWHGWSCEDLLC